MNIYAVRTLSEMVFDCWIIFLKSDEWFIIHNEISLHFSLCEQAQINNTGLKLRPTLRPSDNFRYDRNKGLVYFFSKM